MGRVRVDDAYIASYKGWTDSKQARLNHNKTRLQCQQDVKETKLFIIE